MFPLPHGRRDLWGPHLHQRGEPLIPPIPPARTGMAHSTFHQEDFLLSSPQSQAQVGAKRKELQEWPLSPASLHWVVGDPRRAGGTPGSSLVPYAHLSCSLCLASWMPGLPAANWDTGDLHVTPVPFHTGPRLELEAAGRICQPRVIAPTSWSWLVPTIRFSCLVRTELCFPA